MFPEPGATRAKICGITSAEQARQIAGLGADALGLNFWPRSKRFLPVEAARSWAPALRGQVALVGVVVNASDEELKAIVDAGVVDMLQLHGDESPGRVAEVLQLGLPVIKALQVKDEASLAQLADYPVETLLLDSYNPGLYGGEGKTFPWELVAKAKSRHPAKQFILAGGLTPENVAEAVRGTLPAAVDVASGVETSPGVKDLTKVKAFIDAVRGASS